MTAQDERRSFPRYPFIAHAEVRDAGESSRLSARVSDISLSGCYLDMMNPLPVNTRIRVIIHDNKNPFEAQARIVYSVPNLGAGVAFLDLEPSSKSSLEACIESAIQDATLR